MDIGNHAEWLFLAKGMANCVFRYTGNKSHLMGKVLRLRLAISSISSEEIVEYVDVNIRPFFQKDVIIDMNLVPLTSHFLSGILEMNPDLDLKLSESSGIIMPDLFASREPIRSVTVSKHIKFHIFGDDDDEVLLEFKPKWLYSPPSGYKLCRNCALNLSRYGHDLHELCTLQLLNLSTIPQFCDSIVRRLPPDVEIRGKNLENAFFENHESLQTLCKLQRLDTDIHDALSSLEDESNVSDALKLSMTLKDVTIFLSFSNKEDSGGHSSLKIIDLDRKSSSKFAKWKAQESKLQNLYH